MSIRELQIFLRLSETLHFGKTSAEFYLSPSSLTRLVQRLEQQVGASLFERDNRSVYLTTAGKLFRQYARDSVDRWQHLQDSIRHRGHTLSGKLSLFCSVTASYYFLEDVLERFRQRYPEVEIKLHTGDTALTVQRILEGHEDLGIAARPDVIPGKLLFKPIGQSPLVFIAPVLDCPLQSLLCSQGDRGDVLRWDTIPMILSESGLTRNRTDNWFRDQAIKPLVYAQVSGHEAIVSMVSLGFGVGVVPRLVVDNSPIRDKVRILAARPELKPMSIGLCARKRKLNNALVAAFWGLATGLVEDQPDAVVQS